MDPSKRYTGRNPKGGYSKGGRKTYSRGGREAERAHRAPPHALGWVGRQLGPGLDLRFLGFPTHLSWTILVFVVFVAAIHAFRGAGIVATALWVVIGLVSVVIHELGHAFAARRLDGEPVSIVIHALGGFTRLTPPSTRWGMVMIVLAGPAVGLVPGFVALGALAAVGDPFSGGLLREVLIAVAFWSLLLNLLNLLPIYPLDGGQALLGFLRVAVPDRAMWITLGVGTACACLGLGVAWLLGDWIIAIACVAVLGQNALWARQLRQQGL